ncbi:hypothetical protein ScPMuIL_001409 [Solemya velum]
MVQLAPCDRGEDPAALLAAEYKDTVNCRRRSRLRGSIQTIGYVLRTGTRPNNQSSCEMKPVKRIADGGENTTAVVEAAGKGDLPEVIRLYKQNASAFNVKDAKGAVSPTPCCKRKPFAHINCRDNQANTPLHLAVEGSNLQMVDFLINHGADTGLKNSSEMAPLHVAVVNGSLKTLECLLKHNEVDVNTSGEKGATALHYCALRDHDQCAKKLLEYGAKPCKKCQNGYYPIHEAAKNAAAKTLEVLIQHVESLGYTRAMVLSFADKENNMPLHSAVNSGEIQVVLVCLDAGAPVDAQQEDKSTPLHFASAKGSLEMLKLMHEKQPDRFLKAINIEDVLQMAPLHRAALFNHFAVVEYLLDKGADINARDCNDRTALLLAASKGNWKTVKCLLDHGADIYVNDQNSRNFLHLAIKSGEGLTQFGCVLMKGLKTLLDEKDDFGCTPLHYASKGGYLVAIDDLIKYGATINPKNNDRQSPFYFAARYGRYNTCKRLLESPQGPNIINETDVDGLSALHIAAQNGHTKIITLLMEKGAYVTSDNHNNTPLHLAAAQGYTKSARLLLSVHSNLLNAINKSRETPLHLAALNGQLSMVQLLMTSGATFSKNQDSKTFFDYAIENKQTDVALAIVGHERWEEAMELCSSKYGCPMVGLVQHLPEVCMAVLDRCQTSSEHEKKSRDYHIKYNFKYLQCSLDYIKERRKRNESYTPMVALNNMVKNGRVECLSHPVCITYLTMKWKAYGLWFHWLNLVIYAVFLAMLTSFVTSVNAMRHVDNISESGQENNTDGITVNNKLSMWIVMIFCSLNVLKEILQIVQQKKKYFLDLTNALEWVLYITTVVFIAPFLFGMSCHFQWEAGALAVFLAWFNCLLFLRRFDLFGIYVVMFLEILKTLLQALCVFSILIIAFGLSFYILMGAEPSRANSTPGLSILRTVFMMLELDYMASFSDTYTDGDTTTLHFGGLTFFLLAVFVLLMPILLMNLLIGLAVGDIETVQRDATLKRLAMQVELHTDLERKLPFRLLKRVDKVEYRVFPNRASEVIGKIWSQMTTGDDTGGKSEESAAHNAYLYHELYKQKMRMKEMSMGMQKQYDLLRLIVQKMEIRSEDDMTDEGSECQVDRIMVAKQNNFKGWNSQAVRQNIMLQSSVVSQWKHETEKT